MIEKKFFDIYKEKYTKIIIEVIWNEFTYKIDFTFTNFKDIISINRLKKDGITFISLSDEGEEIDSIFININHIISINFE